MDYSSQLHEASHFGRRESLRESRTLQGQFSELPDDEKRWTVLDDLQSCLCSSSCTSRSPTTERRSQTRDKPENSAVSGVPSATKRERGIWLEQDEVVNC